MTGAKAMRSLGTSTVWALCTLGATAYAASLDDLPQNVTPTLPSPQIQPATPVPTSPLANPSLRKIVPMVASTWDFGCAAEHFTAAERIATQTRFAMPIPASDIWGVLPEPAVTHYDRDGVKHDSYFRCTSFGSGHVCYDGHEGTDFTLGGGLLMTTRASAAASGVVIKVDDSHFDGCHANPDPRAYLDSDPKNNVICPDPEHPESVAVTDPNRVEVCHADGTVTRYLHLKKDSIPNNVTVGSRVECGQVLGIVGSSGRSAAPHLHFDVLTPASRWNGSPAKTRKVGEFQYVHVDPFAASAAVSLWTQPTWNYGLSQSDAGLVPVIAHPDGHQSTLACPHLVAPHSSDTGPTLPCLHPAHEAGDAIRAPCTHSEHGWHGPLPCTHMQHPEGHVVYIAGKKQYGPCMHAKHPDGHPTQVPCLHAPVQQHAGGHPGPTLPCPHISLQQSAAANAFTLPGPQCAL